MDLRNVGFEPSFIEAIHDLIEFSEETDHKSHHAPSRAYIRDSKAMAATPADVKEYPDSFEFILDMPGLKSDQIKVQIEDDNTLVVSGERKRDREKDHKDGVKYVKMERRVGKFLKKFVLPETADTEKISAVYQDGVLVITVYKKAPPEPKKPKTIEVQAA